MSCEGPKGSNGAPGETGSPGLNGTTGEKGDMGPQGLKGASGPPGQKGGTGPRGHSGPIGPKGNRGSTGSRGYQGLPGAQGSTGPRGQKGQKGERSYLGAKGQKGERGLCPTSDCQCGDFPCYARRKRDSDNEDTAIPGVVYTRWGGSNCPENSTKTVYLGTLISSATGNYLCMPNSQNSGESKRMAADHKLKRTNTRHQSEVPCSVCLAIQQSTMLTIPAKTTCPPGWTREYYGYLMASVAHGSGQFLCVDSGADCTANVGLIHIKVDCNKPLKECLNKMRCAVCTW